MQKIAVVTGALKGLGLETSKELAKKDYTVIMTGRDEKRGLAVREDLAKENLRVGFLYLDTGNPQSIDDFCSRVLKEYGRIDVLVNNAGIYPKEPEDSAGIMEAMVKGFMTNAAGPYLLCQKIVPLMIKNKHGRVVNVSSGMGQLAHMNSGSPAYRLSKVALNAVTRIFADQARGTDVLINSVCPGWVKTDMGGAAAPRSLAEGAAGIIWAATLPQGAVNGGFFRDGKPLEF